MKVIVHGGAGGEPDEPTPRQAVLDEAAETGGKAETVVDAVEAAVHVLESSPRFNAGVGGAVQSDGEVRTDAGIMTSDREAGAACSMPGVEHAVSAARVVMEETPHVLVSGDHAVELAADFGVETGIDLWTEKSEERWDGYDAPDGSPSEHIEWLREKFGGVDTVGAVAYDDDEFAAATSTGGRWLALAGRVGDVPQIGSGFYSAPAGAASSTGAGEDIAKSTLTRRAVRHLESGYDAQEAADRAIEEFAELTGSSAGVIVLDRDGNAGSAFNSDVMQTSVNR
jgi:isoaspartyl peptidase/L-asparaginase-like protein (Ntn-hydrolase superfamily)